MDDHSQTSNENNARSDQSDLSAHAEARAHLFELLSACVEPEVTSWLNTAREHILAQVEPAGGAPDTLAPALVSALGETLLEVRRRCSRRHLISAFAARDTAQVATALGALPIGHWRRDEAAKLWLIADVIAERASWRDAYEILYHIYDAADTEGRVVCLRALNFLAGVPEAGLKIIHDAGRTYLNELMEAAWCHSLFASRFMSVEEHRKAVLKSLFCEVSVGGFLG